MLSETEIQGEQRIVEASQKDPDRFEQLYDLYFEEIFNYIFRRVDDEDVTSDLTSQTFLKALQHIKKYRFRGLPFSAWLFRIATNEVNKYYRKNRKDLIFSLEEFVFEEIIEKPEADDKLDQLVGHLKKLSSEEMQVLELRFFEQKSFPEMAFILDISLSNAKMRTYRALDKLREYFKLKINNKHDQV